ncbi:carbohydrate ABC transporter permease [Homoserinibacter sp. GY 40078]|uniref:carbohydrate ABC transporter permease n=1 Tax=Homoserinibacter sp. GY 40078 TaxID=2603275 RepID=UPI0011CC6000|nr:sugar ABC transporter permease [Homoserinibacter sp. GY 40078]TXK19699.1 sugar ABC transporter permease [Homoserinibacter sp. GY 40078]
MVTLTPSVRPLPATRRRSRRMRQLATAAPFVLPGLILVLVFVVWPLIRGIQMSLYDWNLPAPSRSEFIGLDNFVRAFTQDPTFWVAVRNTFLYAIVTVPIQIVLGLGAAVLLNGRIRGRTIYRALFYLPVVTSWLIVSYVFAFLFSDGDGPVNYFFVNIVHILPEPVPWLHETWPAQVPIMVLGIWKGVGWNMVIFLAALQSIPHELNEAAVLDGANAWQRFTRVTLPLLKPTFQFVSVVLIVGAFNVFISVYLLTGGGPEKSTEVLLSYMYNQAFTNLDFGYGVTVGLILGATVMVFGFLQRRITRGAVD